MICPSVKRHGMHDVRPIAENKRASTGTMRFAHLR
jgi:hypothetical protein